MDQKYPKCDFKRKKDDFECPACEIIYDKYFAYIEKKKKMVQKKVSLKKRIAQQTVSSSQNYLTL